MATAREIIEHVDELKPSTFSTTMKLAWINEADTVIQVELLNIKPEDMVSVTDLNQSLTVPAPWDRLYKPFLMAMIDFANGEYSSYQNDMNMFNMYYGEYARWYQRTGGGN